jgi:ATP-binding cassette subfamily B protein
MESNKLKLKDYVKIYIRGIRIFSELFPWYLTRWWILSLCQAAQPLAVLAFSARLLDELAGERDLKRIALYAALAAGVTFALRAAGAALAGPEEREGRYEFTVQTTRLHRAERFAELDFEHVENSKVREKLSGMFVTENWRGYGIYLVYTLLPQLMGAVIGVIGAAILLAGMYASGGASIATALLLLSPIAPILARIPFIKAQERMDARTQKTGPRVNSLFSYYHGIYIRPDKAAKDIRIFGQKAAIAEIFERSDFAGMIKEMVKYWRVGGAVPAAINAALGAAAYIVVGLKALAGVFTIGQVTQYVGAVTAFTQSVGQCAAVLADMRVNAPFLVTLYEFLDMPDVKYRGTLTTEKRTDGEYEIEFKNVSFKYPGAEKYALKDLDLKLRVGRKLAVVGMNGSGKTTMIKLLCRLYDPTEGEITLGGIDVRKYDCREYMNLFSVVYQDFKLTGFSLGRNVAAAAEYDAQRVKKLLNVVGFGEAYPLNTALYKTYDKDGVEISGGEAQKIALARALYRDSPIIILDEPTAALDPIAESEIYSKFDDIVGDRTAIYISHRLSSCRFCDDIAVFHEGRLVQRGGHDELLADEGGKYRELWTAQAQYYE